MQLRKQANGSQKPANLDEWMFISAYINIFVVDAFVVCVF